MTIPEKLDISDRINLDRATSELVEAVRECSGNLTHEQMVECAAWIVKQVAAAPELPEYISEWITEKHG